MIHTVLGKFQPLHCIVRTPYPTLWPSLAKGWIFLFVRGALSGICRARSSSWCRWEIYSRGDPAYIVHGQEGFRLPGIAGVVDHFVCSVTPALRHPDRQCTWHLTPKSIRRKYYSRLAMIWFRLFKIHRWRGSPPPSRSSAGEGTAVF